MAYPRPLYCELPLKKSLLAIMLFALVLSWSKPLNAVGRETRKIAVIPFACNVPPATVGGADVGKELARLLAFRLSEDGTYQVVPEAAVERALTKLGGRFRLTNRNSSLLAKDLGVDAIIIGTVTQFELDQSTTQMHSSAVRRAVRTAGAYTPYVGQLVSGFAHQDPIAKSKVKVGLQLKLVDAITGLPIANARGALVSNKSTTALWKPNREVDFTSDDFASSAAGEVSNNVLTPIINQLVEAAPKVDALIATNLQGEVVGVEAGTATINIGSSKGLKVGDLLDIQRPMRIARQNARTRNSAANMMYVGTLELTDVSPRAARGQVSLTKDRILVGDVVRLAGQSTGNSSQQPRQGNASAPAVLSDTAEPEPVFQQDFGSAQEPEPRFKGKSKNQAPATGAKPDPFATSSH